jgi:hypothetical protein
MNSSKTSWVDELNAEDARERDNLPRAKEAMLAVLKSARIATVTIGYDGESDSGQISEIEARTAKGKTAQLPDKPVSLPLCGGNGSYQTLADALDAFAWALLQAYHFCFQDNEGGFGTIKIDVVKGTVTIDHNDRVVDVCNSLTEV